MFTKYMRTKEVRTETPPPWMLWPWWPSGTVPPMKGNATTSSLQCSEIETWSRKNNEWSPAIQHFVHVIPEQNIRGLRTHNLINNKKWVQLNNCFYSHQLARNTVLVRGKRQTELFHYPINGRPMHGGESSANAERCLLGIFTFKKVKKSKQWIEKLGEKIHIVNSYA